MPEIPLGSRSVEVQAPPVFALETVAPPRVNVVGIEAAVRESLARPYASPPLRLLARGRKNAVICVPDATRPLRPAEVLPAIIDELAAGGLPPDRVGILVGLGLHRPPSRDELESHVGLDLLGGVRVSAHDIHGPMADLGTGPHGTPLKVNQVLVDSDLVLCVGLVEPHQYAGFSGAWKTAVIGCGSEETIAATHSPRFLNHVLCRPGSITGNPFQDVLREAGRRLRIPFAVNVIVRDGMSVAAAAGEPSAVHLALSGKARQVFAVYSGAPADAAVVGVPRPKDRDLYQASRAVTNVVLGPSPSVRPGGVIVLPARLSEGIGDGTGGERFARALARPRAELLAREGLEGGEQRAYMLAKVLADRTVILAGADRPEAFDGLPLLKEPDLDSALRKAAELTEGGRLLVFTNAIGTYLG